MAGRGPTPKDPSRRARHNHPATEVPWLTVLADPAPQPPLPECPFVEGWHPRTVEWWSLWRTVPQASYFTGSDWDALLDTAIIHSRLWYGDLKAAPELRLRMALVGATPADRARLRMTLAQAEEAEDRNERRTSARARRGGLQPLPHEVDDDPEETAVGVEKLRKLTAAPREA